jgi:hypothetical protein
MKLTATQLRRIIAEEVKRATLKEELGLGKGDSSQAELDAKGNLLDIVCKRLKNYTPSEDPGKPDWDAQCEAACEDLGAKIEELISQVEKDLHDGVYGD